MSELLDVLDRLSGKQPAEGNTASEDTGVDVSYTNEKITILTEIISNLEIIKSYKSKTIKEKFKEKATTLPQLETVKEEEILKEEPKKKEKPKEEEPEPEQKEGLSSLFDIVKKYGGYAFAAGGIVGSIIGLFTKKAEIPPPESGTATKIPEEIKKSIPEEIKKSLEKIPEKEKTPPTQAPAVPKPEEIKEPPKPTPAPEVRPAPKVETPPPPKPVPPPVVPKAASPAPIVAPKQPEKKASPALKGAATGGTANWIKEMIYNHEGAIPHPYKDSKGLWTIGVGHLIGDGKSLPKEWANKVLSKDEMMELFDIDFTSHKQAAMRIPGFNTLNEKGQAALIDLTFNMGPVWYKNFPGFMKGLASGDTEKMADELKYSKWYKQVGNRAKDVISLIKESSPTQLVKNDKTGLFLQNASAQFNNLEEDQQQKKQIIIVDASQRINARIMTTS